MANEMNLADTEITEAEIQSVDAILGTMGTLVDQARAVLRGGAYPYSTMTPTERFVKAMKFLVDSISLLQESLGITPGGKDEA